MDIRIGSTNWFDDLKKATNYLGDGFWSRFTVVGDAELQKLEAQIGRKLPNDFKEFYRTVGFGSFEPGICFYSLEDILTCLGAPIYFVLGSLMTGKEWATGEQHQKLWLSRGTDNPAPAKFTDESLSIDSIKLYDLLQFGIDGNCCYYQMYVGPDPAPFRYCLLTDSGTIEETSYSLSNVLEGILVSRMSSSYE